MKGKRKSAISLERRSETTKCIICGRYSDNGKFMCRRCAEDIKLEHNAATAI